jgi:hypothetical protein
MLINRNIWSVAVWLVTKHGSAAPRIITSRITKLRAEEADESAIASWLLVDEAVHELVRTPGEGETRH